MDQRADDRRPGGSRADFAWFEAYLALVRAAGEAKDPAAAKHYQDLAAESVKSLESEYGPLLGPPGRSTARRRTAASCGHGQRAAPDAGRRPAVCDRQFDEALAAYDDAAAGPAPPEI